MAVGVDMEGIKHILGLWVATNEGAAFWSQVCAEIANRGVNDVFIVCCDGLKGFPEAILLSAGSWYRGYGSVVLPVSG
ncbi:hypothetical protein AZH46_07580 [Corynebacterium striatum]|nr:hypothetical protein AZH46_07580 [Corynebacterium striatum]